LQVEGEHGEMERGRARRDGERVAHLAGACDLRLELGHLWPGGEHPALEHLGHLGQLGLAETGIA